MSIIKWVKWKLYMKLKDRYKNSKLSFFRNNYKLLIFISIFCSFITFIFSYSIGNFLIKHTFNLNAILAIMFSIIILSSFWEGIRASNYYIYSIDKEWLKSNFTKNNTLIRILIYSENIIFNSNFILTVIIPLLICIYKLNTFSIIIAFKCILILFIYILIGIVSAYLYNIYTKSIVFNKYYSFVIAVILKGFLVVISYNLGDKLFPIFKNLFLSINKSNTIYLEMLEKDVFVYLDRIELHILNYAAISKLVIDKYAYCLIFILIFCIVVLNFICNYIDYKIIYNPTNSSIYFIEKLIKYLENYSYVINKTFLQYIKIFFRSSYTLNNISSLTGNMFYWVGIGIISSLISNSIYSDTIFYYLLLSFVLFMPIYKFGINLFNKFAPTISLESDGAKIYLQLMAKQTLWNIFNKKVTLFILIFIPNIIIGDLIIFILGEITTMYLIGIMIIHITAILCCAHLYYLPSILAPHFNFTNIAQISEYKDKSTISSLRDNFIYVIIHPTMLLPTVLFITNEVSFTTFLFSQILVNTVFVSIITLILRIFIKSKLTKFEMLDLVL